MTLLLAIPVLATPVLYWLILANSQNSVTVS